MRLLTDSEREAMQTPLREYWAQRDGLLPSETRSFEAGFIAALDHSAAQIAALTAERDGLRQRIASAYQKFGGGHHPYAGGAVDALDYVSGKENEARRALDNPT